MILTDKNGKEVELTPIMLHSHVKVKETSDQDQSENLYILKVVKKPKWSVNCYNTDSTEEQEVYIYFHNPKEANAIKAFIEAGLEYIYGDNIHGFDDEVRKAAISAIEAIEEANG